jgi:hypothetical protein
MSVRRLVFTGVIVGMLAGSVPAVVSEASSRVESTRPGRGQDCCRLEGGAADRGRKCGEPDRAGRRVFQESGDQDPHAQTTPNPRKGIACRGYGPKVDEFVLTMNRAAEKAAPQAREVFVGASGEMSFADAGQILTGGDTAAIDYFKAKMTDKLTAAFRPTVEKAMSETGVTSQYKDLVGRFKAIPFAKRQSFDIDQYVVSKALDGLFHVLGEEERQIRKNPAARVTSLLKDVFGR